MKLACIGPLSPLRTGVAHFTENLLPFLAELCEIKLFTAGYSASPSPTLRKFPASDISEFISDPSAFDAALYHMGNHYRYHKEVFETLWKIPGIVVLHDCVLNHFFVKYALERGNFTMFRRLFELCYPEHGDREIAQFYQASGDPYSFPMAGVVAMRSLGTIVMNEYGRGVVLRETPGAEVLKINHPYFPSDSPPESVLTLRKRFNVPEKSLIVTSIGHMTPAKRIDVALEAFRKFREKFSESIFLLAGESAAAFPLANVISSGPFENVRYLGYLSDPELYGLMEMSDVCINLRYPSSGEMSGILLHMLGRGKAVVVSNYAQFAEFPDAACVKINLGPNEADDLARELLSLAHDEDRRRRIGEAARNHIKDNHSRGEAAAAIVKFVRERLTAKPLLSVADVCGLLSPDDFSRRFMQMFAYNTKALLSYIRKYGAAQTLRLALQRASVKIT